MSVECTEAKVKHQRDQAQDREQRHGSGSRFVLSKKCCLVQLGRRHVLKEEADVCVATAWAVWSPSWWGSMSALASSAELMSVSCLQVMEEQNPCCPATDEECWRESCPRCQHLGKTNIVVKTIMKIGFEIINETITRENQPCFIQRLKEKKIVHTEEESASVS